MGVREQPDGRPRERHLARCKRLFIPMRTGRGVVGVVGIDSAKEGPLLTPEQQRLFDALIDQAALAVDRCALPPMPTAEAGAGSRPAALGAAHLDLARSQDTARGDHRRGGPLRDFGNVLSEVASAISSRRCRRKPTGSIASSPISST